MNQQWALITGASSGIGAAMAKVYAQKNINLVLVARRQERLEALANDLQQEHSIKTMIICQDLGDVNAVKNIIENTDKNAIHIDILVNNAGFGLKYKMMAIDWQTIDHFLNVMVRNVTHLTHHYGQRMIQKKSGKIIFIASTIAFFPGSQSMTLYNAVKTYMIKLGEGLWGEFKPFGVDVTTVCPGLTETEFQEVAGYPEVKSKTPKWAWLSADAVALQAIQASEQGKVLIATGWINKVLHVVMRFMPGFLWRKIDSNIEKVKR